MPAIKFYDFSLKLWTCEHVHNGRSVCACVHACVSEYEYWGRKTCKAWQLKDTWNSSRLEVSKLLRPHTRIMEMELCFMSVEKLTGCRSRSGRQKYPDSNRNFSTLMETSLSQVPSASSWINCLIFTKDFEDEKIPEEAENEHSLYLLFPAFSRIHRATVSLMQLQDDNGDDLPGSCKQRASSDQDWECRDMTLPWLQF